MTRASHASEPLPWAGKLRNKVALVTGSSRGIGRGIALVLGEAGATVYVTGRTTRGHKNRWGVSGTIHDTAAEVSARGGFGIPVRCDHSKDAENRKLVGLIRRECGHVDILVNNAFGGADGRHDIISYDAFPFWKHDFDEWWYRMFTAYLRSTLATTFYALPLMLRRRDGLIINTLWWNRGRYLWEMFFDLSSNGVGRMVYGLDLELRTRKITAVGLSPGWTDTEAMVHYPEKKRRKLASPEYAGRAVVYLAMDPNRHRFSGKVFEIGELARQYGFRNVDGRLIDYHAEVAKKPPAGAPPD
jgi:NAD(P)-dependent dehydrogenase (short-subunit alcohol dehydrogenase family)